MRSAKVSCRHFANPAENLDSNMSASSTLSRSCRLRCSCQVYFAKELGWGSEARQTLWAFKKHSNDNFHEASERV